MKRYLSAQKRGGQEGKEGISDRKTASERPGEQMNEQTNQQEMAMAGEKSKGSLKTPQQMK